jgi:hypothetical protein
VIGSGTHYEFVVKNASPASGTLSIGLPAGATADLAGNPSLASNTLSFVVDRTAPTSTAPLTSLRASTTMVASLPARVSWGASDVGGAGVASYDLARSVNGGAFSVLAAGLPAPVVDTLMTPGLTYRYEGRARDAAGNVGAWVAGPLITPLRYQNTSGYVGYSGTWYTGYSSLYFGGSVRYGRLAGARASLSVYARSVAFMTTRGPTRGVASVYVDGVLAATVDLYAPTGSYRYVAFSRTWTVPGTHSVRVVVAGTAGRPRVDLDAFEVLR